MKSLFRGSLAFVGMLAVLGTVLAVARGGGASSVDEKKWLARNNAVFGSLHGYPMARFYLSKTWGIPDRIVHDASANDNGPPYSGYVTERRYNLPKPVSVVDIGDFYARQLPGWARKNLLSCESSFTSPKGASVTVDACYGAAPMTPEYVVDVNYDEARSIAEAGAHGY